MDKDLENEISWGFMFAKEPWESSGLGKFEKQVSFIWC